MKLNTLLCCLLVFATIGLYGQVDRDNSLVNQSNVRDLINLNPTSIGSRGFDNRYEGVKGTPFLFDDFQYADLQIKGKDEFIQKIEININLEEHYLLVRLADGTTGAVSSQNIARVVVEENAGLGREFVVLPPTYVDDKVVENPRFYELLHDGDIKFFKLRDKLLEKADYKGAYSTDRRFDEFIEIASYYLGTDQPPFTKVKLKEKAFTQALPGSEQAIERTLKSENLDIKEEKDAVKLLQIIDNRGS
ncbi:MAG: hypothetical protein R3350_08685 [Saprospiraceae bacterium]|nr:hypothetical protein [Saprospiraceae bacterium]